MNILVTGSSGFIGRQLCAKLLNEGHCLQYLDKTTCKCVFEELEKINWYKLDRIYHLGAISDSTSNDLNSLIKYNVTFFKKMIERTHGIPIVFTSSASIYGNSSLWKPQPLNLYATTKLMADYMIRDVFPHEPIVSYRLYNVYGKHEQTKPEHSQSPIFKFTKQAKTNKVIEVFEGSDGQERDFICVEDVVDTIIQERDYGFYDVGTTDPISFMDVAKLVAKKYDASIKEIPFPNHLKNKYQTYTCAREKLGDFKTVEQWLKTQ